MSKEFYMQDSRQFVGNDLLWWAKDGMGYTCDLSKAQVWDEYSAMAQHESRGTDVPWPKEYIDARTRPTVDAQHVEHQLAFPGEYSRPEATDKPTGRPLIIDSMPRAEFWANYAPGWANYYSTDDDGQKHFYSHQPIRAGLSWEPSPDCQRWERTDQVFVGSDVHFSRSLRCRMGNDFITDAGK